MRKGAGLILALCLSSIPVTFGQEFRLPRNPDKLIDRALNFWALISSNQRFRALEFVLPEKRDLFVAGRALPILKAKVVGLDVTTNAERGAVRTAVEVLSTESPSGSLSWTITDPWVWKDDNWYISMENPPDVFPHAPVNEEIDIKKPRNKSKRIFTCREVKSTSELCSRASISASTFLSNTPAICRLPSSWDFRTRSLLWDNYLNR